MTGDHVENLPAGFAPDHQSVSIESTDDVGPVALMADKKRIMAEGGLLAEGSLTSQDFESLQRRLHGVLLPPQARVL